ncbi:FKBP-type peptidyl-prolyl cis-trans isomerase [Flavobacterium fluviatile]|uniref:FKBP-type peptidyl-prolyl cis-trans isomerase n=1 Tax=Flavobacterium fluviatile TaxID=1862387 RepID=UPI0013D5DA3D|nr:FKBP-type peptidyl-prolyl cis-trans isomerase [Flavobacterium fluviatile]
MNKIKYFFILLIAGAALVSCNKDDDDDEVVVVPLRDYQEQYEADNDSIEKYLKTHYIEEVTADFDIKITKIPAGGTQESIFSQTQYPLQTRDVYNDNITYKVYYLVLNEGTGESPCNFDRINAAYVGNLLDGTVFDTSDNLGRTFDLDAGVNLIDGWKEIFPKLRAGKAEPVNDDGTITYSDFGAGVMFLPSGLAYYSGGSGEIKAYSPLVFSVKLYDIQRLDHDGDGILDINEDINGDGYVYDFRNKELYANPPAELIDDTDGDGLADFIDTDDDGDGYTTLLEITKPTGKVGRVMEDGVEVNYGPSKYFPFEKFDVVDDPATPNTNEFFNTEPKGIPAFVKTETVGGVTRNVYDYETLGRKKIHLDKDHNTTKVTTVTTKK